MRRRGWEVASAGLATGGLGWPKFASPTRRKRMGVGQGSNETPINRLCSRNGSGGRGGPELVAPIGSGGMAEARQRRHHELKRARAHPLRHGRLKDDSTQRRCNGLSL
ncbi:hypothetical protein MRX96_011652 [Rhipicephalus microplus]